MNLLKLQDILGESIEKITNENLDESRKVEEIRNAQNISIVAKQMISNANIIFRGEKAISEGKFLPKTMELIGYEERQK